MGLFLGYGLSQVAKDALPTSAETFFLGQGPPSFQAFGDGHSRNLARQFRLPKPV